MRVCDNFAFSVLGPVEGRLGGRALDLGPRKQRLVLAALLLGANRTVSTDRLVDLTWPDSPPPSARTAIHGRISRLRALLAGHPEVALVSVGSGYTLRIDPATIDAHRFTELLTGARASAADDRAAGLYDQALALWRGPALDGTTTEDVRRELCGHLEEARLQAVDELADVRLRLGLHRDLVESLTSHLAAHPTRERTAGQLALALYRCGQASDALDVCRRTRRRLHDDLGIDPGPDLTALEVAILRKDVSLDRPAEPVVRTPVPAHLPPAVAGFTGRAAELRRLTETLSDAGTSMPVAVITGPAGVGKSALAVHCAHGVAARYPDGQLHVNLRGYDLAEPMPPVDALGRFLRALGLPPGEVPADEEEAMLAYRSLLAGRRVLVVLDNAAWAEQVRPLLPGSAGCGVLVTSRDDLRGLTALDGAWPLRLDVLSPAESLTLLGRVAGADRLAAEPDAAAELARLCDHLPLALRIAGAHLAAGNQPIAEYTAELAQGSRLGKLAIPEDPRAAVGSALDLSYRVLAPRIRLLFRRLGLVPGPDFTAAAAATLAGCSVADAAADLDRLVAAHLVREHTPGRFQCHDLIRLYALERVAEGEPDTATADLYAFYLSHLDAAARVLYPHKLRLPFRSDVEFAGTAEALAWVDAELANLVAAVYQAARGGQRRTACLLADALRGYFFGRGMAARWLDVANTALSAAATDEEAAAARLSLGEANWSLSRYPEAVELYLTTRDLARHVHWDDCESTALGNLGIVHRETGQLRRAAEFFEAALDINVRIGNQHKQVLDLMNLGVTHAVLGKLASAAQLFERAATLGRSAMSPAITGMVSQCLGLTRRYLGDFPAAARHLRDALAIFEEIDDRSGQANVLESLAGLHADAGRPEECREAASEALRLAQETGARRVEAAALIVLGLASSSDPVTALAHFRAGLELAEEVGYGLSRMDALIGLADVHVRLGDSGTARRRAEEALALARETSHRMQEGQALTVLAAAVLSAGDPTRAADLAETALAVHREMGYTLGVTRAAEVLAKTRA